MSKIYSNLWPVGETKYAEIEAKSSAIRIALLLQLNATISKFATSPASFVFRACTS